MPVGSSWNLYGAFSALDRASQQRTRGLNFYPLDMVRTESACFSALNVLLAARSMGHAGPEICLAHDCQCSWIML